MSKEVVLVQGGGANWSHVSQPGDEPAVWHGLGSVAGPLTVTVHSVSAEPDLTEFAHACMLLEKTGYAVVLDVAYKRLVAWLNADGQGWPPRNWKPGDAVLTRGVRNFQGDGEERV